MFRVPSEAFSLWYSFIRQTLNLSQETKRICKHWSTTVKQCTHEIQQVFTSTLWHQSSTHMIPHLSFLECSPAVQLGWVKDRLLSLHLLHESPARFILLLTVVLMVVVKVRRLDDGAPGALHGTPRLRGARVGSGRGVTSDGGTRCSRSRHGVSELNQPYNRAANILHQ